MKRVKIEISGSSEAGNVETVLNGVLITDGDDIMLRYYEEFEGYSEKTKNNLTISHDKVLLEKTGAVNAVLTFEMQKEHKTVYHAGVGPIEMLIKTRGIFTRYSEEGLDVSLDYSLDYGGDEPSVNSLKLKARYI